MAQISRKSEEIFTDSLASHEQYVHSHDNYPSTTKDQTIIINSNNFFTRMALAKRDNLSRCDVNQSSGGIWGMIKSCATTSSGSHESKLFVYISYTSFVFMVFLVL